MPLFEREHSNNIKIISNLESICNSDILAQQELYELTNKLVNDMDKCIYKLSNVKYLSNDIGILTASFTLDEISISELKRRIDESKNKFDEIKSEIFYLVREYYKIKIESLESRYKYIQELQKYNSIESNYYKSDLYFDLISYVLNTYVYENNDSNFIDDLCRNPLTPLDFMIFLLETNEIIHVQ